MSQSMSFVVTTPAVSKPTDKGVTSNVSHTAPGSSPASPLHRGPVHHSFRWLYDVLLISQVLQATRHIAAAAAAVATVAAVTAVAAVVVAVVRREG